MRGRSCGTLFLIPLSPIYAPSASAKRTASPSFKIRFRVMKSKSERIERAHTRAGAISCTARVLRPLPCAISTPHIIYFDVALPPPPRCSHVRGDRFLREVSSRISSFLSVPNKTVRSIPRSSVDWIGPK